MDLNDLFYDKIIKRKFIDRLKHDFPRKYDYFSLRMLHRKFNLDVGKKIDEEIFTGMLTEQDKPND